VNWLCVGSYSILFCYLILFFFLFIVMEESQSSSVSIVTRLQAGQVGFNSCRGQGMYFFLFAIAFRPSLACRQLPIKRMLGTLSLGVKYLWCEGDHSPPASTEVQNVWSCTSILTYVKWQDA
jgi:hypothetical protein